MKLNIILPDQVRYVMDLFGKNGYEIYIVGGVVRDAFLDKPLYDWDFTTNAKPEDILKLVPDSFYDNSYGTVGIKTSDRPFEITTFRTEHGYTDGRHPDEVRWGETLAEDLSRRDFTVNAMALNSNLEVIDLFGGVDDIHKKLIRCVGKADLRFNEDALRMMRAVRIAAQLQFAVEEETFMAIKRNADKLYVIAWERIRDELLKIMGSDWPADGYLLLRNTGLANIILPEMEKSFGVEQKSPGRHHIYDVGTHSVEALRFCPSPNPITRLATLIHDVGKVKTQRTYPDGRITFYNHEMESAKIAKTLGERLKLSGEQKELLYKLVRWHQFTVDEKQTDSAVRRFIVNVGKENIFEMLALRTGDRLGGGARETSWRLEEFKERIVEVQKQPFSLTDLKVSGNDVMEIKKVPSGPLVGKYLTLLFNEVVENNLKNERDELVERLKELTLP